MQRTYLIKHEHMTRLVTKSVWFHVWNRLLKFIKTIRREQDLLHSMEYVKYKSQNSHHILLIA